MPDIPTMTLKTMQFNPVSFVPAQYEYKAADMNILERSLAQKEARLKEAVQNKGAVDKVLGELQLKLNPAEANWFETYKQDIRNKIQSSIDAGDPGNAIIDAQLLGSSVAQDPRILGRIRAQEAWTKEITTQQARRDKGEISQNTYDWWVDTHGKYKYTDKLSTFKDENGNYKSKIIEDDSWIADTRPVADINWAVQAKQAFELITPSKDSSSSEKGGKTVNATGTGSSWTKNSSKAYQKVTIDDIRSSIERNLDATPDSRRQVEQDFDVKVYEFKKLEQQYKNMSDYDPEKAILEQKLNERKKLLYNNGSLIDYKEYYARMVTNNLHAEGLAYNWEVTSSGKTNSTDNEATYHPTSPNYGGGGSGLGLGLGLGLGSFFGGPMVRQGFGYNFGTLNGSTNGINGRFGSGL